MDRIESRIERQIREARENGAFDDLPGAGRPLPGRGQPYDEDWWVKDFGRREGLAGKPEAVVAVRVELAELTDTVDRLASEDRVRAHVEDLNDRIVRARRGLDVELSTVEVERVVRGWRARRATPDGRRAERAGRDAQLRDSFVSPAGPGSVPDPAAG